MPLLSPGVLPQEPELSMDAVLMLDPRRSGDVVGVRKYPGGVLPVRQKIDILNYMRGTNFRII